MKLSILDQSPISEGSRAETALKQTIELAKFAEAHGYERFWVSEHHFSKSLAGSSPEVLIGAIAAQTKTIRVGSGGVMLQHYSPYKVAENFRVLEGMFPGRIDLGIGRAPGGMPISSMALQESKRRRVDIEPGQLEGLVAYLYDLADENHRYPNLTASPLIQTAPELWMLGSSGKSAEIAARLGASYTFAHFINGEGGQEGSRAIKETLHPLSSAKTRKRQLLSLYYVRKQRKKQSSLPHVLIFHCLPMNRGCTGTGSLP
jgi:luciferase family oxidoreductase group 1